ncbi:MAG: NADH-quinone oxidoreductase subunit A [Gemmataceae bacterium]|nr:NADH-quinone oxidoreductase subunit A [Gemmataceae bacterium]
MPDLVLFVLIFLAAGVVLLMTPLLIGRLVRPDRPSPEKGAIYECGEPTIGPAWVQFDLRFYVVALLFVIFDVELAFFFPWAVVFGSATRAADPALGADQRAAVVQTLGAGGSADPGAMGTLAWVAFADLMVFFGVLLVGFAYLWRRGDLDWVRSTAGQADEPAGYNGGVPPEARP